MAGYSSITPSINVNTASGQLRTELLNTFVRLDGQLTLTPFKITTTNGPILTSSAAEETLLTTNIGTGTLSKEGSSLLIHIAGTTGANANNKTIKLYFGGTQIFTTGAFAGNDISWTIQAEVIRNGASAQICYTQFVGSATLTTAVKVTTASVDLASPQVLKLTGQGTAAGDISAYYWKIILLT